MESILNNITNTFYRVTRGIDVDSFTCEFTEFFSKNKNYALEYAEPEENPILYTVELDIKNPFGLFDSKQVSIFNNEYSKYIMNHTDLLNNDRTNRPVTKKELNTILKRRYPGDILDLFNADYIYDFLKNNYKEYDGLIVDEGFRSGEYNGILAYVPFYSNQIKILDKEYYNEN